MTRTNTMICGVCSAPTTNSFRRLPGLLVLIAVSVTSCNRADYRAQAILDVDGAIDGVAQPSIGIGELGVELPIGLLCGTLPALARAVETARGTAPARRRSRP